MTLLYLQLTFVVHHISLPIVYNDHNTLPGMKLSTALFLHQTDSKRTQTYGHCVLNKISLFQKYKVPVSL